MARSGAGRAMARGGRPDATRLADPDSCTAASRTPLTGPQVAATGLADPSLGTPLRERHEVRQERRPAAVVTVAQGFALGAESLPARVFDLDPGPPSAEGQESDLDVGRVGSIASQVPQVAE